MGIKLVEITGTIVQDIDVDYIAKEEIVGNINESVDINALNTIKKKSILVEYIENIFKRTFDIIAGLFGIVVLIPLTIFVAILNFINKDYGPIFYTQDRIGKNGKHFKMFKYRTMVIGADEKLKEYLQENETAKEEYRIYKKLKNDPRVTKVGKLLRKTSLDEMPQLLHLLTRRDVSSRTKTISTWRKRRYGRIL